MKERVDVGSLEHKTLNKSSNISAAFPTAPKLFGRIQVWSWGWCWSWLEQSPVGTGWAFPLLEKAAELRGCSSQHPTYPMCNSAQATCTRTGQQQGGHIKPPTSHTDKQSPDGTGERQREASVCVHFTIWGKLADSRAQSFATSADRCEFKQASNIAATLLLLMSARTATKERIRD